MNFISDNARLLLMKVRTKMRGKLGARESIFIISIIIRIFIMKLYTSVDQVVDVLIKLYSNASK